jgi:hypothetical protein
MFTWTAASTSSTGLPRSCRLNTNLLNFLYSHAYFEFKTDQFAQDFFSLNGPVWLVLACRNDPCGWRRDRARLNSQSPRPTLYAWPTKLSAVYVHPTAPNSRQALSLGLGVDTGLASHAGHHELALSVDVEHARHRPAPAARRRIGQKWSRRACSLLHRQIRANTSSARRRERL